MKFIRPALIIAMIVLFTVPSRAEKLIWKREFVEHNCKEAQETQPQEGDHVLYKCSSEFGLPMWRVYYEGVRSAYGFGRVQNFANYLGTTRRGDWPVEWGGIMTAKKFVPRVVIARFNFSDEDATANKSELMVFRLLPDGTSCTLSGGEKNAIDNAVARKMAQDPNTKCIGKGFD